MTAVKSNTELPSDPAGERLFADKIVAVSTERPSAVGPASKLAATISGKVYTFPK